MAVIHTYIHTFYLLKNQVKANNIYKLSMTNEQDNKAASCTYSCPLKTDDTPQPVTRYTPVTASLIHCPHYTHRQFDTIICVRSSWKCTKTVFGHGSAPITTLPRPPIGYGGHAPVPIQFPLRRLSRFERGSVSPAGSGPLRVLRRLYFCGRPWWDVAPMPNFTKITSEIFWRLAW